MHPSGSSSLRRRGAVHGQPSGYRRPSGAGHPTLSHSQSSPSLYPDFHDPRSDSYSRYPSPSSYAAAPVSYGPAPTSYDPYRSGHHRSAFDDASSVGSRSSYEELQGPLADYARGNQSDYYGQEDLRYGRVPERHGRYQHHETSTFSSSSRREAYVGYGRVYPFESASSVGHRDSYADLDGPLSRLGRSGTSEGYTRHGQVSQRYGSYTRAELSYGSRAEVEYDGYGPSRSHRRDTPFDAAGPLYNSRPYY